MSRDSKRKKLNTGRKTINAASRDTLGEDYSATVAGNPCPAAVISIA